MKIRLVAAFMGFMTFMVMSCTSTKGKNDDVLKVTVCDSQDEKFLHLSVSRGENEIQKIDYDYPKECFEDAVVFEKKFYCEDLNFDGFDDIRVYLGSYGNQGVSYWQFFLWDNEKSAFVKDSSFDSKSVYSQIPNPRICSHDKCITASVRESAAYHRYMIYNFVDGKFILSKQFHELTPVDLVTLYGLNLPENEDVETYALKYFSLTNLVPDSSDSILYVEEDFSQGKSSLSKPMLKAGDLFYKLFELPEK